MPERRITSPGSPIIEIEQLDEALEDTCCVACGRPVVRCACTSRRRAAAAARAEQRGLRRRLHEELARVRSVPGALTNDLARLAGAAPRWLMHAALRAFRRRGS